MIRLASITFETNASVMLFTSIALVITAFLSLTAMRRSHFRRIIVVLETVRFLIVLLVVGALNQPERLLQFVPSEKPTIAVLWDDSASMKTRDIPGTGDSKEMISRREAIADLTQSETWEEYSKKFKIVIEPFSSSTEGANKGTDIGQVLEDTANKHRNLLATLLISDGLWNRGKPPTDIAASYRLEKSPIYTICSGSKVALPDLEVSSLDAPTFAVIGKPTRIPFTLRSSLAEPMSVKAVLTSDDGQELATEIEIPAGGVVNAAFQWKPKQIGGFTITLKLPTVEGEVSQENNQMSARISVRQESLRVLVVDTYPRWEYRFLRNALQRDPGVSVSCVLSHPNLANRSEGKDYLPKLPDTVDELSKYDVIFLGDIGQGDGQLSSDDCERLKAVVRNHAVGLVFMPGIRGNHLTLAESELSDLLPVIFDPSHKLGRGSLNSAQLQLTDAGSASLLTKLADSPEANRGLWRSLPGFQWYTAVERAKTGAQVLAVHENETNQYGRIPLLVTKTSGVGKVLYMGTDGAWRWREGVEDKYHYRFWGQVVRWMAYQRKMAGGQTMRLFYTPDRPRTDSTLTLNANVMAAGGEPLHEGDVTVQLLSPSGKSQQLKLLPSQAEESWGLYTGLFTPNEAGRYQAKLTSKESGESIEAVIDVQGAELERIGQPANPEALAEVASISRGKAYSFNDDRSKIFEELRGLAEPAPQIKRIPLWAHPGFAAVFLMLLTSFWVGRKLAGVV